MTFILSMDSRPTTSSLAHFAFQFALNFFFKQIIPQWCTGLPCCPDHVQFNGIAYMRLKQGSIGFLPARSGTP
jgi:hypothetical protein